MCPTPRRFESPRPDSEILAVDRFAPSHGGTDSATQRHLRAIYAWSLRCSAAACPMVAGWIAFLCSARSQFRRHITVVDTMVSC
jgi:hypothetical protein